MKLNMGMTDRVLRVVISAVIIMLFAAQIVTGIFGIILLVLAGVFTLTGLIGTCPLYLPFGITTLSKKEQTQG